MPDGSCVPKSHPCFGSNWASRREQHNMELQCEEAAKQHPDMSIEWFWPQWEHQTVRLTCPTRGNTRMEWPVLCIVSNTYVRELFHSHGGQEVLALKRQEDRAADVQHARSLQTRIHVHDFVCAGGCVVLLCLSFPSALSNVHQEAPMHSPRCQDYQCPERFKPSFAWVQIMQNVRSRTSEVALLQSVTWHRLRHSVLITGLVLYVIGPCSVTQLSFAFLSCASYRTHRKHLHCQ